MGRRRVPTDTNRETPEEPEPKKRYLKSPTCKTVQPEVMCTYEWNHRRERSRGKRGFLSLDAFRIFLMDPSMRRHSLNVLSSTLFGSFFLSRASPCREPPFPSADKSCWEWRTADVRNVTCDGADAKSHIHRPPDIKRAEIAAKFSLSSLVHDSPGHLSLNGRLLRLFEQCF